MIVIELIHRVKGHGIILRKRAHHKCTLIKMKFFLTNSNFQNYEVKEILRHRAAL